MENESSIYVAQCIANALQRFMICMDTDSITLILKTFCEKRLKCYNPNIEYQVSLIGHHWTDFIKYRNYLADNKEDYNRFLKDYRRGVKCDVPWNDNIFNK